MLRNRFLALGLFVALATSTLISSMALAVNSEKAIKACATQKLKVTSDYSDCLMRAEQRVIKLSTSLDTAHCDRRAERRWSRLAVGVCARAYGADEIPGPDWDEVAFIMSNAAATVAQAYDPDGLGLLTSPEPCAADADTPADERLDKTNDCFDQTGPTYDSTLGKYDAGVLLHLFDGTEADQPWLPGGGHGHSASSISSSFINKTIRYPNGGPIAIFKKGGGIIFTLKQTTIDCMYFDDEGTDQRPEDGGCGCRDET